MRARSLSLSLPHTHIHTHTCNPHTHTHTRARQDRGKAAARPGKAGKKAAAKLTKEQLQQVAAEYAVRAAEGLMACLSIVSAQVRG